MQRDAEFFPLSQSKMHMLTPTHLPYDTEMQLLVPLSIKVKPNSAFLQVEVQR